MRLVTIVVHVNKPASPIWPLSPMWLQFDIAGMASKPTTPGQALRVAREEADMSQEALAKKAKTTRQTISRLEKDERDLDRAWAFRLGPHVNRQPRDLVFFENATDVPTRQGVIPMLGEVAAGRWIEIQTVEHEPDEWLPFTPEPGQNAEGIYALRVSGNSMDQIAPDGCIVICRDLSVSGVEIQDGDRVIVERLRQQEGLREVTMKEVRRLPRGAVELVPKSSDKRWKPVIYSGRKQADALDLRIIATVEYIVLPARRRRR